MPEVNTVKEDNSSPLRSLIKNGKSTLSAHPTRDQKRKAIVLRLKSTSMLLVDLRKMMRLTLSQHGQRPVCFLRTGKNQRQSPGTKKSTMKKETWKSFVMCSLRRGILSKRKNLRGNVGVVSETHRPDTLLLDWDQRRCKVSFPRLVKILRREGIVRAPWIMYRRTKKGWHVVVRHGRNLTPEETVRLQKKCESDRWREKFNSTRTLGLKYHSPYWQRRFNVLFRRKL